MTPFRIGNSSSSANFYTNGCAVNLTANFINNNRNRWLSILVLKNLQPVEIKSFHFQCWYGTFRVLVCTWFFYPYIILWLIGIAFSLLGVMGCKINSIKILILYTHVSKLSQITNFAGIIQFLIIRKYGSEFKDTKSLINYYKYLLYFVNSFFETVK